MNQIFVTFSNKELTPFKYILLCNSFNSMDQIKAELHENIFSEYLINIHVQY